MKPPTHIRWSLLLPFLPVLCGLLLLVVDSRPQQALRNLIFDQYQRWQPRAYVDVPVRIVDIDEASLARLGQWPWPRTRIAELLQKVGAGGTAQAGPAANMETAPIGFDVLFAEPDRTSPREAAASWPLSAVQRAALAALPDHDAALARALAQTPAVLGFVATDKASAPPELKARFVQTGTGAERWLHGAPGAVTALPQLAAAAAGLGAFSFVPDSDGIVRRVPLVLEIAQTPVPTLVSEMLRLAENTGNIVLQGAGEDAGLDAVRIGARTIPATPAGEVWVHYTPPVATRTIPAWKVLDDAATRASLAGKFILIGSSAQGLLDLRFSPFGPLPGVEIHAQALEQILIGHYLQRPGWARAVEALALMLAGLGIGFLALRTKALVAAAACALTIVLLFVAGWHAFAAHGLLLDVVTPASGVLLTFIVCSLAHHFVSERDERWIKTAFARYVSPNRVEYLIRHPEAMELGGRRQECSFIFTDLQGFTGLIEKIAPAQAVTLLNAYLDEMIAIVFRHDGTLDRIIGDALVVMFSAPVRQRDHKHRALACAIEMDAFASRYSAQQQAQGIAFGKTRIGVHAGNVTVGNFGGSRMFDYRALGDPINTAARLESVNKHLGTRLCVSEAILAASPNVQVRPVGQLVLKGKTEALRVFEPLVASLVPHYAPLVQYRAAFAAMQEKRPDADALFAQLAADYPDDPLVALHHRRLAAGEQGDLIVMQDK
ncbi:MAG: adenylate/guanylate cyclase domain-containing protein [Pseudomonadota bacterium]